MNVVFVNDASVMEEIKQALGAAGADARFFSFQWEAAEAVRRNGLNELPLEEVVSPEQAEALDDLAMRRADDWYLDDSADDFTRFRDISLGRAYSILMYPFLFFPVYRYQSLIQAIFKRAAPSSVWCDRSCPVFFRELLAAHPDVAAGRRRLTWVGQEAAADPTEETLGPSLAWRIRGDGRTGALQRFALRHAFNLLAALARGASSRKKPALLVSYHHTMKDLYGALFSRRWREQFSVHMLERPPKEHFVRALFCGARMLRPDVSGDVPAGGPALSGPDAASLRNASERWNGVRRSADYAGRFDCEGVSLFPFVQKKLNEFMSQKLEDCARWVVTLEELMARESIRGVIAAIDSMPRQSVMLQLARKHGIPSVNPIHGIPLTYRTLDYRNAGFWAVGGRAVADSLRAAGRPGDRIISDAACIFDRYGREPSAPTDFQAGNPPRILLLSSPRNFERAVCPFDEAENYLFQVLGALAGAGRLPVTIKLHPAESLAYYQKILGNKYPGIALVQAEDFDSVARRHDVVIGPGSTALIQSVLLRKRVVCAAITRYRFPAPFAPDFGIPVAHTGAELKEILVRVLSEPPEEVARRAAMTVAAAVGVSDGNGAERLLSLARSWAERRP